jgi:hypothetical protein
MIPPERVDFPPSTSPAAPGKLDDGQVDALGKWIDETVPTSTRQIGSWLRQSFGVSYTRSGLVKLLAGIGFVFHKPKVVPRTIDVEAQRRFTTEYEALLNGLRPDEAVMFIDAVHPAHQSRPAGCWTRKACQSASKIDPLSASKIDPPRCEGLGR